MTLHEAVTILKEHNEWRRDNTVPPKTTMANPKLLGEAIDLVVYLLSFRKKKNVKDLN